MKQLKTTLILLLVCLMNIVCIHAANDGAHFKVFIDFLKQEQLYYKSAIYYPFPFGDVDWSADYRNDYASANLSPERIRQLLHEGIEYNKKKSQSTCYSLLKLPYRIKIDSLTADSYRAEAFITLPDSSATLHLNADNIGVAQHFDLTEITLMSIEENVAYLLIEDKSHLVDYSYTKPGYIFTNEDEEENEKEEVAKPWEPFYNLNGVDIDDWDCTASVYDSNDGFTYISRSPITGIVRGAKGAIFSFETLSEDFRHYLWYRNMDMPNSSMKGKYQALQNDFEAVKGGYFAPVSGNQSYPLHVIRLQASGRISDLDITVFSRAAKEPLHLNWTSNYAHHDYYKEPPSLEEMTCRIANIVNLPEDSVPHLTVAPYSYHPQYDKMGIVAFLPYCYNTLRRGANLSFTQMTLNDGKTDLGFEDYKMLQHLPDENYFWMSDYGSVVKLVDIPTPAPGSTLSGEVSFDYPNVEAQRFDVHTLPEGLRYENDTLFIGPWKVQPGESDPGFFVQKYCLHPEDVLAYDREGKQMSCITDEESEECKLIFDRPVAAFIHVRNAGTLRGKIPFSITTPAPLQR